MSTTAPCFFRSATVVPGFADFRAELWFDERLTLRAFRDFLSADALFNRPPEQTLAALYRRSLENQQEVSTTLGRQVRRAVEMFVAALEGGFLLSRAAKSTAPMEAIGQLMTELVEGAVRRRRRRRSTGQLPRTAPGTRRR